MELAVRAALKNILSSEQSRLSCLESKATRVLKGGQIPGLHRPWWENGLLS
jgi:hypothetical protein